MAKLNLGVLKQQNENLEFRLNETLKSLEFERNLRKIENLNETNFQIFLAKQVSNLHLMEGGFYLPVASTSTTKSKGVGKFSRQCG